MANAVGQIVDTLGELPRHWWVVALRGLAAIIFGILAFVWPGLTLEVLVLFFGAYAFVDGALTLYTTVRSRGQNIWGPLLEGTVGISVGLIAFFWPGTTALTLLIMIAAWAILTGGLELYAAIRLRRVISNEWSLAFSGVLSVIFGILLLTRPDAGAVALGWLLGLYAVVFGVSMLVFAWRLRGLLERMPALSRAPQSRAI